MASVSLQGVNKIFKGNTPIVKDLSLEVNDSEFLVLVGPSGCGKTTTLRMIAGLEEVTSGNIYIEGRLVNNLSPKDRDIAMVFQNYALYPHMNVYDNMAFGLKLRKVPRPEINRRVNEVADLLELKELLRRKPKELSGGQRQRVAMGRAIVREPKVFLMDEPLSNLDAKLRIQMRAELSKLHQRLGITTIYVTHDQVEAMTLGQRIVVMNEGVIQQAAPPLDVYEKPKNSFVAGFIGSPSMNFIEVLVNSDGSDSHYLEKDSLRLCVPDNKPDSKKEKLTGYLGKKVLFGIRPEDIYDRMFATLATPLNTLKARVDVVEPMGSEVILYLNVGKSSFVARVNPHTQARVGQEMEVVLDLNKMHAFDVSTGVSLFNN